jgi:hypothetical protein
MPWKPLGQWWMVALACFIASAWGCSGGDGRLAVSGTVTVDGKPLEAGAISFAPEPGSDANTAGGVVKQGKFDLPSSAGLKPGKYRVNVTAMRKTGRVVQDPMAGAIPEQVPIEFNETGSLSAVVQADNRPLEITLSTVKGQ